MIILYDIDNKRIKGKNIIVTKSNYYIVSRNWFKVTVVSGNCQIYFTTEENSVVTAKIYEGEEVNNITLMIQENLSDVVIRFENDSTSFEINFHSNFENQLTEATEHYNDLLINYYLPTIDELEPALLSDFDKREFIKRMLLDFRDILRKKGNVKAIRKFFYLIGFVHEQISVVEEWEKPDKTRTTYPDKNQDIKTGDYQLIFKNWFDEDFWDQKLEEQYHIDNTPYRPLYLSDFTKFCEAIKYAIPLANKYFLAVEQEITKFAINFSSNQTQQIFMQMIEMKKYDEPNNIRLNTHITILVDSLSTDATCLVFDNLQKKTSFVPYLNNNTYMNNIQCTVNAPGYKVTGNLVINDSTTENIFNNTPITDSVSASKQITFLNTSGINAKKIRIDLTVTDSVSSENFSYEFNIVPNITETFKPKISGKISDSYIEKTDNKNNPIINPITEETIKFYLYTICFPNILSSQSVNYVLIDKYTTDVIENGSVTGNTNKTIYLADNSIYNLMINFFNPITNNPQQIIYQNIISTGTLNYEDNFDIRNN